LTIEEKTLAVKAVGTALGFHVHASVCCARAFGFGVACNRLHRADGGLANGKIAAARLRLPHAVRLVLALP
jgi:hypothetical protein